MLVSDLANDTVGICVFLHPDVMVYEEVETFQWEVLVANIGNQLSLWLGISFLSLFQAVHYCLKGILKFKAQQTQVVSVG